MIDFSSVHNLIGYFFCFLFFSTDRSNPSSFGSQQSKLNGSKTVLVNGPSPASILLTFVHFKPFYRIKTVDFSGIQTRIDGVEGKHADHVTTTTAHGQKQFRHLLKMIWDKLRMLNTKRIASKLLD